MELKEARKMAKAMRDASPPRAYKTGMAIMALDDRITELEDQRNLLYEATNEMLNLIGGADFDDSSDEAPNKDDMNRWYRALQIKNSLSLTAPKDKEE